MHCCATHFTNSMLKVEIETSEEEAGERQEEEEEEG